MALTPQYLTDTVTGDIYRVDVENGILVTTLLVGPIPPEALAPTLAHGLSPSDIIEMAMKRTERRGKNLDLKTELVTAAQELCQEKRWHWRKRSTAFWTLPDVSTYDLSAQSGMSQLTCERVCGGFIGSSWQGPRLWAGNATNDLTPIFETEQQENAREATITGTPGQYFLDGQDQLRLVPTPSGVFKVRVPMWVLPDSSPMDTAVTLVPAYLHHLLVKRLEAQIFRFSLGEGNAKYLAAQAEYDRGVLRASLNTDFADGRVREWRDNSEEAIQSS